MAFLKVKKRWGVFLLIFVAITILAVYPLPAYTPIQYVDRESGVIKTEKVAGEKWLLWLYNNPVGETALWTLAKRKFVSSLYGKRMDNPASVKKIEPFINEFDVDLHIAKKQEFNSFNDFFTRELLEEARPIDTNTNIVVSPADGKILVYDDIGKADFIIKGYRFDVFSFLEDPQLAQKYIQGTMLVIRLAPMDYHRFHFPVSGAVSPIVWIEGDYYSVNPFALRKMAEIFCLNKREYLVISNPLFGEVIMAEVGATMVGSIIQTYEGNEVAKGEEKGYFKFGGSTVVLLFEKGNIRLDEDLLINSRKGLETSIIMGERVGEWNSNPDIQE
jgi:phosphatidylserine decarboxylase